MWYCEDTTVHTYQMTSAEEVPVPIARKRAHHVELCSAAPL